uniref:ATPase family AAA domain-containing protein 5 n=1 Tax=Zeugodacus cucurbitae TaxID=28588 RepID=A0A0A1WFC4_ZEUCU
MQSVDTTNSDDSDTIRIYDFKNQTTVVVHNEGKPLTGTDTTAIKFRQKTVEPFQDTATNFTPIKYTCKVSCQNADVSTPTLGPTPNAFKFLQPKRRIIDPSQMLPLNEEAQVLSFGEKSVVEEEVAQVMPSVKALAQAFLLSSNKCSQAEKRWKKGIQKMPSTSIQFSNPPETYTENIVKVPEKTEDTTISSDLSSLETDPSINVDISTNKTSRSPSTERTVNNEENNNKNTTNMLRRVSMLKSNIAFFENLKFK